MKREKLFWIKERHNQNGVYFVAEGPLSKTAAKRKEKSLAGFNIMHGFPFESDYNARIAELKAKGEKFV